LIGSDALIDKDKVGYLFGLQSQIAHFIRVKSNFISDLLASLILKFPVSMPDKVVARFSQISPSTLSYKFSFDRCDGKESDSTETDDWMNRIVSVTQDLCVDLILSDEIDVESAISSMARSRSSISAAQSLLQSIITKVCIDAERSENFIANLLDKSSASTLQLLCLLMSYGDDFREIKVSLADTLIAKSFKSNMIIVKEKEGRLMAYSLVKTGGASVWAFLQKLLERSNPNGFITSALKNMILAGDAELKKVPKKKKGASTDFDKLKFQASAVVKVYPYQFTALEFIEHLEAKNEHIISCQV
jgi:hypothetical protein